MIVRIDREKRIILLKWLRQGFINTLDLPEAYKDSNLFLELLMETGVKEDEEEQQEKSRSDCPIIRE